MSERKESLPESETVKRVRRLMPSVLVAGSLIVPAVNALSQEQVAKITMEAKKATSVMVASDLTNSIQLAVEKKPPGGGGWVRVWGEATWTRIA